jgi:hypothetical protein
VSRSKCKTVTAKVHRKWTRLLLKRVMLRNFNAENEHGSRLTRRIQDPLLLTGADILEHEKTHLRYCSWCRHCVRGRGKHLAHRRAGDVPDIPELYVDFSFMGEETEAAELLGLQSLASDLGCEWNARVLIDSSAAKSMASRIGLGRVRNLEVRYMLVQGVQKGRLLLKKLLVAK